MTGPPDLERFVAAQKGAWPAARAELAAGTKRSHWMWFVFPQLRGLGRSPAAQHYALKGLDEAAAYLAHPVLGARLVEAASLVSTHAGTPPERILGPVDALKLRSCLTLFSRVPGAPTVLGDTLAALYDGPCERTLSLLEG